MVVALVYLSCIHLHRQYYDYGSYSVDITGPLMIITQKVVSLAFSIHDGFLADPKVRKFYKISTIFITFFCFRNWRNPSNITKSRKSHRHWNIFPTSSTSKVWWRVRCSSTATTLSSSKAATSSRSRTQMWVSIQLENSRTIFMIFTGKMRRFQKQNRPRAIAGEGCGEESPRVSSLCLHLRQVYQHVSDQKSERWNLELYQNPLKPYNCHFKSQTTHSSAATTFSTTSGIWWCARQSSASNTISRGFLPTRFATMRV